MLSFLFCQSHALLHRVRVFLKTSGSDIGSTVELQTNVRFNLPVGSVTQQSLTSGLPETNEFPGFGELLFDRDFNVDPTSIRFNVVEDDGAPANDDGVCRFLAQPPSWPVGTARFDCLRESNNGLNLEWHIIMLVDSS